MKANQIDYKILLGSEAFLKSIAYKFTRNEADAKDLVQETLFRAVNKFHQFKKGTSITKWTGTIMRNIFINSYRKKRKANLISYEPYHSSQYITENDGEYNLTKDEIASYISELKPDLKEILMLRVQGYSYNEICDQTQLPLGSVKSKLFCARQKLKKRIQATQL